MSDRPNILILNPDQWRGDVMGHMGDPAAVTPNLDQAVQTDAVSFSRAFCQNTVCTPSRCSFMTGWYPHTKGHRTMYHMLRDHEPILLERLKDTGYFVWWGGKNDLVPGQDGHEHVCNVKYRPPKPPSSQSNTHGRTDYRGEPGGDNYYSFYVGKLEKDPGQDEFQDHDWGMVRGAVDFIGSDAAAKSPFCVFLSLGFPHPPYAAEEPFYSMIDPGKVPPRTPTPEDWSKLPSLMKGIYEGQGLQGWTEDRWQELRRTYYAMCARVDHQYGLLVEALKQAGLYENTAIFMFSDHGDFTGDYGLVEKTQNTFQDCLSRVPMVVKPPASVPVQPRVSGALTELIDFTATVYEWTGVEPGYSHFGRSLTPVLTGQSDENRDAVFCEGGRLYGEEHCMEKQSTSSMNPTGLYYPRLRLQTTDEGPYHTKAAMCRDGRYKYVRRFYEIDELYDLETDPGELDNRIDDPALADVRARLAERMLTWYMETCDVVPHGPDKRNF